MIWKKIKNWFSLSRLFKTGNTTAVANADEWPIYQDSFYNYTRFNNEAFYE